jgi:hypothetical protein
LRTTSWPWGFTKPGVVVPLSADNFFRSLLSANAFIFPVCSDTFEKDAGWFVISVLADKPALKCLFKNRLPQPFCFFQVELNLILKLIHERTAPFDFGGYPLNLGKRR